MQCGLCRERAMIAEPSLCAAHFIEYFERKVDDTIDRHHLIEPGSRIAVAVSGGKDSLTVLTLLQRRYGNVTAIAIDEGIDGYREKMISDARALCETIGVKLVIRRFEDSGNKLDAMVAEGAHPCTACGKSRRDLLNLAAQEFDVLATGHNADDESQAVLMNIIKGNTELFSRIGPSTKKSEGFTRRVKPLYFCTEKEVMAYAFLKKLVREFSECPYAARSYRALIRDELNRYAQSHPFARERLLRSFLVAKG